MTTTGTGADPAVVGPYLADVLGDEAWRTPSVTLIAGGKSNLTYRVSSSVGDVILRRPPLGHVLPTAHDMNREYTAMAALETTDVPVPKMLHLCRESDLLGQPFYVMEAVDGYVCRDALPPGYADEPPQRRAIGEGLIRVLGDLHNVDPQAVGLGELGRPVGYLDRQVARWTKQWEATRIDGMESIDALAAELAASVPASQRATIVHGDYRLDNTMLDPTTPGRIAAVLDWEMCTLGDPLADLGILLVYWQQPDDVTERDLGFVVQSATVLEGFPNRTEVASLYADRSGLDLGELHWYVAFAFWKLAVVCAGIVARVRFGAMVGEGFDGIQERIPPLVDLGRATLSERRLH
ncbi:MAG: putative aminoglycoside phosphotransferase [Frankiales bacterium]|nr:putative aminoglycoside phosphotransferase [Frankiales bacterium]